MRYFLDTEFIEAGRRNPVTLISIGIVAEDGRSFYAVSSEFNPDDANDWVKANVLPHLGEERCTVSHMQRLIAEFCDAEKYGGPEFWGYFCDYDWVVFCQIFGAMIDLPKGWPMFCRDIKQLACDLGNPKLPKQESTEHNALNDAKWNKAAYEFLAEKAKYYRLVGKDSGVAVILDERLRQIWEEKFTFEHDDRHNAGELNAAAICYAAVAHRHYEANTIFMVKPDSWPWGIGTWKPSDDQIKNLVKAGALIAAEIDRLQREKEKFHA